jgi:hypothetical protein
MALLVADHPVHDLWKAVWLCSVLGTKAAGKADRSSGCTK